VPPQHLRRYSRTGWPRPIACLIFIVYFPPKSPIINASLAERDLQLKTFCSFSPSCTYIYSVYTHMCACASNCESVPVCVRVYVSVYQSACACVHACVCARACVCACVRVRVHVHVHVRVSVRMRVCMDICTHTYIHMTIYIYTRTYMYKTHMNICIHSDLLLCMYTCILYRMNICTCIKIYHLHL